MDRPTYRATSPVDMLGALPALLGFTPAEAIVVIAMQPDNPHRVGMAMRLDLPSADESVHTAELIDETMKRHHIAHTMVIGLSEDRDAAHHIVGMIEAAATATVILSGVASQGRFYDQTRWEFDEPDPGEPYGDLGSSPAVAYAVTSGQVIHASREAMAAQFAPAPRHDYCEPVIRESLTGGEFANCTDLELIEYAQSGAGHSALISAMTRDNVREFADRLRMIAVVAHPDNAARVYGLTALAYWLAGDGAGALVAADHAGADSLAVTVTAAAGAGVNPATWWDHYRREV